MAEVVVLGRGSSSDDQGVSCRVELVTTEAHVMVLSGISKEE